MTVVTVTRRRPLLLAKAIESVKRLDFQPLEHLLVIDDCPETMKAAKKTLLDHPFLRVLYSKRRASSLSGPPRLGYLRNFGVKHSRGDWVTFLDDDNQLEPSHLGALVRTALRTGATAVHSQMKLFYRNGRPYLEARVPWERDREEAEKKYHYLLSQGIAKRGSNIYRDRIDPLSKKDGAREADMGEWLFRKAIFKKVRFKTVYDRGDWERNATEDDKLLDDMLKAGVKIRSSKQATLRYYVGGYTSYQVKDSSQVWKRPRS